MCVLFISLFSMTVKVEDAMLPCLNKQLLGIECPGCGIQRSVALLFKGEFIEAFYMYPAIYTLILLFAFLFVNAFQSVKYANKIIIGLAITNIAIILINYLLKLYH